MASQPSTQHRFLGSIFTLQWSLGLLLSICFFLPLARGCSDEVISPVDLAIGQLEDLQPQSSVLQFTHVLSFDYWIARPYLYGLALAVGTLVAVAWGGAEGRRFLGRWMLAWSCLALGLLLVLMGTALCLNWENITQQSPAERWQGVGFWFLVGVPPLLLVSYHVSLHRRGHLWWGITVSQFGWALLSALRFGAWLDPRQILIGGKLALAISLVLMEVARLQHHQGEWAFELSQPPPWQFTTRYLLALTSGVAIYLAWALAPLAQA